MKNEWEPTQESFEQLLRWLHADREQAGINYEKIRVRLIKIFRCRGCANAEDLSDETINRVSARLRDIVETYSGEPALYFYGVAQKVYLEYLRQQRTVSDPSQIFEHMKHAEAQPESEAESEREYQCLDQCMGQLSVENRGLVLGYYSEDKQAKIQQRKKMASELKIAANALRIRAHRIRLQLQACVTQCLNQSRAH
jgi:RNA polymerase sigma factor (sigma-70 family)